MVFCILIYDVGVKTNEDKRRLLKVYDITRRYLKQAEYSVFYGEITIKNLRRLLREIKDIINIGKDSVIVYLFKSRKCINSIISIGIEEQRNII